MSEIIVQANQQSQSNLLVHCKENVALTIPPSPIQEAIQLWTNICDNKTKEVYQQAAGKTWELFKQAFKVILFLFQLLIALIIWISGIAFQIGQSFRNKLEIEQPNIAQIIFALFQLFLWPLARAYDWADSFIQKYLKWDNPLIAQSPAIKPEKIASTGGASIESSSMISTIPISDPLKAEK